MMRSLPYAKMVAAAGTLGVVSMPYLAYAACTTATYYGQATYYAQATYNTTFTTNVLDTKDFTVFGYVSKGSGTFVIDNPLDPKGKLLFHSFVESPDAKDVYDGVATLDKNGEAVITLPAYFQALNEDFRYELKPVSPPMPNLFVKTEVRGNTFTVGGGVPGGKISWQVTGTRHDAYIVANPIVVVVDKDKTTQVDKGEFLHDNVYTESITQPFTDLFWNIIDYIRGSVK